MPPQFLFKGRNYTIVDIAVEPFDELAQKTLFAFRRYKVVQLGEEQTVLTVVQRLSKSPRIES